MTKILKVIFRAVDEFSDVTDDLTGVSGETGIGGVVSAINGIVGPAVIAAGAISGIAAGVYTLMEDFQEHVIDISNFAASLGVTTEEASGLKELMDTYDITDSAMLRAFKVLADEGIDPSLEGLATLGERFDEADSAAGRLELGFDLLGKEGVEQLMPMFDDLTYDQIANYLTYMDGARIVSEGMTEDAREMRDAVDELSGKWGALKLSVMGWAAPGLTALIELLTTPFGPDSAAAFINKFFGADGGGGGMTASIVQSYSAPVSTASPDVARTAPTRSFAPTDWDVRGFQHGGEFTVGGYGGPDSQLVQFMATPGEPVKVGGGRDEALEELLAEVRRLVNLIPVAVRDAVERVL